MPTSTFAKSRPRRQRRKRGVKPTAQVKGYQLNKMIKQVKKMIPRPERKNADVVRAATTIITTPTITNLSAVTGISAAEGGAVGDQYIARSIFIRFGITPNATAGINYYRVMIVLDHQSNAAAPAATEILQTSTNYLSPLNDSYSMRFKVIFDKTFTVDTDANGAQVDKVYRKLRYKAELFGSGFLHNTNGLYLLEISNEATNGPSVQWYSRLKYIDV